MNDEDTTVTDTYPSAKAALDAKLRLVPDFPEKGVVFQDLTPVLADPAAFRAVIDGLVDAARRLGADLIGGLDARGFLLGSAVAYELGIGVLAIRKAGKLPPPVIREDYELEYGTASLEVLAEGLDLEGRRVVLIDDVLATGGTLAAASRLVEKTGAINAGKIVVLEVDGLGGRDAVGSENLVVLGNG
ncbi:adenine phosphoribosyltransferase [Corynebacterium otitidis]|uniref:Adenine phosphoribosyltransferase n=1 Tax=Corynebacterium otitidis ATCC 51513 TaxID=883169 RepID=I7L8G2_9CORY|nr:adenine phosphoribosyltransferase [Corynebacterium otitidis]EJZ83055.1 adenine phosphoribosyltransferase [Corynebacterium otitidis ATCC 51513]KKO83571.1 adenine phosphoribosyltransferase [Corynebacterium otitidis]CCI83207.1 adenine phosphoribosyltransferase [Corynebacterium otitidis ATCC 51513]